MRGPGQEAEWRFEALFRSTRDDILRYLLRRAPSPEDAADLLAETYAIAWQRLDAIPPGEQARLWLFGVARNLLRKGGTRWYWQTTVVEQLAHELQTPGLPAPEREASEAIDAAIKRLPRSQREVVLLTAWEGLRPREIAAVTGAPINLVRVRLHRARVRLRSDLAHLNPGHDSSAHKRGSARPRQRSHPDVAGEPF